HAVSPAHTFSQRGLFNIKLTVSDGTLDNTATIPVVVGGRPAPVIVDPPEGTVYRAGDTIHFGGYATDPEAADMPPSDFSWNIVILHENHVHPFMGPLNGVDEGEFVIPTTGHPPENVRFRISFTATDSDGIPTTVSRVINPVVSPILFDSDPSG